MKQKNYLPPESEFFELAPNAPVLTGSLDALANEATWSYDGEEGDWIL